MSQPLKSFYVRTSLCPYVEVRVSPLVLFSALDNYIRRSDTQTRVIGTLLGAIDEDTGIVHVKNAFPVPHTEEETVAVNMEFHHNMVELYRKVQPMEAIVGWYATGTEIKESSVLLHDFYHKEMNASPIHILIGTNFTDTSHIPLLVFHGQQLQFTDKGPVQEQFMSLPWRLQSTESDRMSYNVLAHDQKKAPSQQKPHTLFDLDALQHTLQQFSVTLLQLEDYVDKVLSGQEKPDEDIGRIIEDTMSLSPVFDLNFDKIFTNGVQDLLMVIYLANLTRSHLLLAEKLQLPLHN